jgi:hypothetical protein
MFGFTRVITLLSLLQACHSEPAPADFGQCDRDCRWHYGFFDRTITGTRVGALGHPDSLGRSCRCSQAGKELGKKKLKRAEKHEFDAADYWCGNFSTQVRLSPSSMFALNLFYVCPQPTQ